jgi:hypothetical protein
MIEVSITADTKRRAGCSARATLCLNQFFAQRSARGAKLGLTFGERGQLLVGGLFLVNCKIATSCFSANAAFAEHWPFATPLLR